MIKKNKSHSSVCFMMNQLCLYIVLFCTILFIVPTFICASQNKISIANISINKTTKEIKIKSKAAILFGILEYLLVGDHGKTYESVFKISDNKPSELNFALLLVGFVPLDFQTFVKIKQSKNGKEVLFSKYKDSLLRISFVTNNQSYELNHFLHNRENLKTDFPWVFTGGFFDKNNRYTGDFELNFIGIWADPTAVVNLFSNHKNPYQGNFGFEIKKTNQPFKMDQDVEIIIRRY